jgi:hypothetical protein
MSLVGCDQLKEQQVNGSGAGNIISGPALPVKITGQECLKIRSEQARYRVQ